MMLFALLHSVLKANSIQLFIFMFTFISCAYAQHVHSSSPTKLDSVDVLSLDPFTNVQHISLVRPMQYRYYNNPFPYAGTDTLSPCIQIEYYNFPSAFNYLKEYERYDYVFMHNGPFSTHIIQIPYKLQCLLSRIPCVNMISSLTLTSFLA